MGNTITMTRSHRATITCVAAIIFVLSATAAPEQNWSEDFMETKSVTCAKIIHIVKNGKTTRDEKHKPAPCHGLCSTRSFRSGKLAGTLISKCKEKCLGKDGKCFRVRDGYEYCTSKQQSDGSIPDQVKCGVTCTKMKNVFVNGKSKGGLKKFKPEKCSGLCQTRIIHDGSGAGSLFVTCKDYKSCHKDGECSTNKRQTTYCTSKQQSDGSIPKNVKCVKKDTSTGSGKDSKPKKPKTPKKPKKWRKFIKMRRKKRIMQKLRFKALTPAKYKGNVKRNYEIAYGIGLGIYNTTARAFIADNAVTSQVVGSSAGTASTSLIGVDALVQETGISVEFKADTDNSQAEENAKAVSATSFKDDVTAANAATGGSVPVPTESDVAVDKPTEEQENSGKSSGEIVRPVLVASLLVLLVATVNLQG